MYLKKLKTPRELLLDSFLNFKLWDFSRVLEN